MIALPEWRAARLQALTASDGWLNLTDRVEIAKIPCTVGSGPDNDLRLAHGPAYLGRLLPGHRFETPDGVVHPFSDHGNPMVHVRPFLLEIHTSAGQPAAAGYQQHQRQYHHQQR